ncbi:MAG: hypothetical protein AB7U20_03445 [Planctomycetaceae bacterium]
MKKVSTNKNQRDVPDEYDFSKGVRGKYAAKYAAGTNVVVLPPDLARAFPTTEAVIGALRELVNVAQNTVGKAPQRKSS